MAYQSNPCVSGHRHYIGGVPQSTHARRAARIDAAGILRLLLLCNYRLVPDSGQHPDLAESRDGFNYRRGALWTLAGPDWRIHPLYDVLYPVQDEISQIPAWEGRITSFLEHYNGLAGYLNLVLPFCLVFAVGDTDHVLRALSRWCLAFGGIALLLTQSRGGLLAFVAMLMVQVCISARDRNTRMKRVALVLIVCLLAAAVAGFFFQRLGEIDDFTAVSRLAIWAALSPCLPDPRCLERASGISAPSWAAC